MMIYFLVELVVNLPTSSVLWRRFICCRHVRNTIRDLNYVKKFGQVFLASLAMAIIAITLYAIKHVPIGGKVRALIAVAAVGFVGRRHGLLP